MDRELKSIEKEILINLSQKYRLSYEIFKTLREDESKELIKALYYNFRKDLDLFYIDNVSAIARVQYDHLELNDEMKDYEYDLFLNLKENVDGEFDEFEVEYIKIIQKSSEFIREQDFLQKEISNFFLKNRSNHK